MSSHPVVLFLDIDGVLHPVGGVPFKQRLGRLPLLEALLREPALRPVGVVVSSTWRLVYTLAQLRSQFAPDLRERLIACTPQLEEHRTSHARHEEIAAWLARHPGVAAWVAVDDDMRGFPDAVADHVVYTNAETGLVPHDIDLLRARLTAASARAAPAQQ